MNKNYLIKPAEAIDAGMNNFQNKVEILEAKNNKIKISNTEFQQILEEVIKNLEALKDDRLF